MNRFPGFHRADTGSVFLFRYKQLLRLSRINDRLPAQVSDVAFFTGWIE
jgi:hypothetical protein